MAWRFHLFTHLILLSMPSRFALLLQMGRFPFSFKTPRLSIHPLLMGIYDSCLCWLLWIQPQWTQTHRSWSNTLILFPLAMLPQIELLDHVVISLQNGGGGPPSIFHNSCIINSMQGADHIPSDMCYFYLFYNSHPNRFTDMNSISLWVVFIFIYLLVSPVSLITNCSNPFA